jgi:CheY-like chemotaxis protein
VRDDGVGIPPHIQESIFELFVQGPRTLERSNGGLGVGLTLVRSLVKKHGGTVSVHSDGEGKGSEFVVRLPISGAEPELEPVAPEVVDTHARRAASRVVLVEDNADNRMMLCDVIEGAGCDCHAAENGVAGLAMIQELRPQVAIIDIGLPGLDGFELARRVRADPALANILLVALTGYGQREDRNKTLEAGFDQHLVKPVDPQVLVAILKGVTRSAPAQLA